MNDTNWEKSKEVLQNQYDHKYSTNGMDDYNGEGLIILCFGLLIGFTIGLIVGLLI